jgi:hypothetical protein
VQRSEGEVGDLYAIDDRIGTVADEARCFLATQHQRVAAGIAATRGDDLRMHVGPDAGPAAEEALIAPIVDLDGDTFVLDTNQRDKQADWTFDDTDSGRAPADRIDQARLELDGDGYTAETGP